MCPNGEGFSGRSKMVPERQPRSDTGTTSHILTRQPGAGKDRDRPLLLLPNNGLRIGTLLPSASGIGRHGTHLLVGVPRFQGSEVLKHVKGNLKCGLGNFNMWCPATELLIRGDTIGQDVFVDARKV